MKCLSIFLWLGLFGMVAQAEDRIYCGEEDRKTQVRLEAKSKRLVPGETLTLKPGGEFSFQVKCEERLPMHYRLEITLQRAEKPLVISRILMARKHPLTLQTPEKIWRLWVD